jgi:hypothetical protein
VVTVTVHEPESDDSGPIGESDTDRQDIEWWDEFDGGIQGAR